MFEHVFIYSVFLRYQRQASRTPEGNRESKLGPPPLEPTVTATTEVVNCHEFDKS